MQLLLFSKEKLKGIQHSPLNIGSCCNSKSVEFRYLDDPCDFFVFFFIERLANGSILSTNVPEDIVTQEWRPYNLIDGFFLKCKPNLMVSELH